MNTIFLKLNQNNSPSTHNLRTRNVYSAPLITISSYKNLSQNNNELTIINQVNNEYESTISPSTSSKSTHKQSLPNMSKTTVIDTDSESEMYNRVD